MDLINPVIVSPDAGGVYRLVRLNTAKYYVVTVCTFYAFCFTYRLDVVVRSRRIVCQMNNVRNEEERGEGVDVRSFDIFL